jgi:hypothetical protein
MAHIKVNINQRVGVKLTDEGRRIYREIQTNLQLQCPAAKFNPEPKVDENGYYWAAIWSLMRDFGSCVGSGLPLPFETDVLIETQAPGEPYATNSEIEVEAWRFDEQLGRGVQHWEVATFIGVAGVDRNLIVRWQNGRLEMLNNRTKHRAKKS